MFLIDSDHFSLLHSRPSIERSAIEKRTARCKESQFFIPIIVFHERIRGWNSLLNRNPPSATIVAAYQKLEEVISLFADSQVAEFSSEAADRFNELRASGVRIGTMDLRIASIALVGNFTLLTRNAVDFDRVPGLRHEDWTVQHRPK